MRMSNCRGHSALGNVFVFVFVFPRRGKTIENKIWKLFCGMVCRGSQPSLERYEFTGLIHKTRTFP